MLYAAKKERVRVFLKSKNEEEIGTIVLQAGCLQS